MRSKKLLVTLVTLILLLTCCGSSTSNSSEEPAEAIPEEVQQDASRFSAEEVEISGICSVDYSCIITDHQTGRQFLYTWHSGIHGNGGGATMVEIGTVDDTNLTDE